LKTYAPLALQFAEHLQAHVKGIKNKRPSELYDPEAYILSLGGKRLRPLLALIACDLFDVDSKAALDAGLAVELFHNFSLIHDDILDAAPIRRGQDTVHMKWNTNIAILSGDVMLVKSLQVLQSYSDAHYARLSRVFHTTAIEVCEGQQLDMNFETAAKVSVPDYIDMICKKTAVLLGASLQMGAIAAGASSMDQARVYEFGKHLGIAFQLLDDLLDAFADAESNFGKQIGGDILANKKTFLYLKTLELANGEQKARFDAIVANIDKIEKVQLMLSLYRELNIDTQCNTAADVHTQLAISALEGLEVNSEKKNQLIQFAHSLLKRQN
jgi:geranylgeranyl diphosphate synthase type II